MTFGFPCRQELARAHKLACATVLLPENVISVSLGNERSAPKRSFAGLSGAGATGLEPATSGVTGPTASSRGSRVDTVLGSRP